MTCDDINGVIEAFAVGEELPVVARAHIDGCPRCAERLALARRIERLLADRPTPSPSEAFTMAVLGRLRRERWRAEQAVDIGFNIAVAAGVLLIVAGLAGVGFRAGAFQLTSEMAAAFAAFAQTTVARAVADVRVITAAMLLLSTAFGLWWWAEEDVSI